jgi:hypothetical protein
MKKTVRTYLKTRVKKIEKMIKNNCHEEEFVYVLNINFLFHFDREKFDLFGGELPKNALYFELDKWRCRIDETFMGSSIMVCFYKPYEDKLDMHKYYSNFQMDQSSQIGKFVKRLSLSNFIFKHCNPKGLEILEKSVIDVL